MFTNIRTFVRLLVTTNLAELTVVAVGFPLAWFLGLRDSDGSLLLPLGAAQILWVNLVTDGLPALAIAFDARPGALDRPPRRRGAPLFERSDLYLMAVCSVTVGALGLGILEFARTLGESSDAARTALLVFVCATQLALVDPIRRLAGPVLRNRVLQAATLASLALLAAAVAIPGMRRALDLEVPSAVVLCTATALVAVPWAAARAVVHLCRRAETRRTTRIA